MAQLEDLADTVNYLDDRAHVAGTDMISVLKDTSTNAASILPTLSRTTLAGMSAALLHMGESSEASGTALNTLFAKVSNAPAQSESFQAALVQLGMSAEELQSGALTNAEGTMMNLFERIQGLDGASKKNVLAELFGPENINNISKISGNYEEFLRVIKMGNAEATKGSLTKGFKIQSQSPERKQEGLQAAIARMEINIGQPVLPDFASLLGSLSKAADWIGEVSKEYPTLSSAAFKLTGAVVGTSVALSTLAWVGWSIISPFASIYEWSKRMELAARLNTGAQWAWNTAMSVGKTVMGVGQLILRAAWTGIVTVATWAWTAAQWVWNAAMVVGNAALGVGQLILRAAWTGIVTVATWAWTAAQWAWNAAMAANPIGLVIAGIALLVGAGYWLVSNWATVQVWWNQLWNDPAAALQSFIDGIYSRFGAVINWIKDKKKEFKNFFGGGEILYDANDHVSPKVAMQVPTQANGAVATAPGIPLNGTPQAMALGTTAGHMMDGGTPFNEFLNGATARDKREGVSFTFNPSIYLNGGDSNVESKLRQVVQDEVGDFESRMTAFMEQQRRLEYA
jgi:TP901 family phage tail tape measure protein